MATILDLQDRGLRYGVIVDAAATPATLAGIERAGLRYKVEVASGITAADRATLDRRGLQYFVPVSATVSMADRAILERQGLRYAVPVDAAILPADLAILERQGLSYFVEVDSSGNAIATAAGGGLLLVDEANGFATDFTHAVDAERVALKTAGATTYSTVDGFYANAGTSPKMVYDVAGVLGWSPHNLLLQSSSLDAVNWNKGTGTIALNAISAPNGAMEADGYILPVGGGTNVFQNVTTVIGTNYTLSAYLKNGPLGNNWFHFAAVSTSVYRVWFNLATGAKGTSAGSPTSYNITSVGDGWYRCDITFVAGATSSNCYFITDTGDGAIGVVPGDGISPSFYSWGAQLNIGAVPTAYLPTTTAARVGLALDYDPVTHAAKGLLCEPQGTNLLLNSNDSSSASSSGVVVTPDNATAPDGTLTADTLALSANGFLYQNTAVVVAAGSYTGSIFLRAAAPVSIGFRVCEAASGTPQGIIIAAVTTEWKRFQVTATTDSTDAIALGLDTRNFVTGDDSAAKTVQVWGWQLETGTVATSHIPTLAASVTRAADVVRCLPAQINHTTTAGSWRVEATINAFISNARIIGFQSGTTPIYQASATSFGFWDGPWFGSKPVTSILGSHKVAVALADANRAGTADGLTVVTDAGAGALSGAGTSIGIGCDPTSAGADWSNAYIRKLVYVPRRKSNAELVTETTP